jgi:hypothetical protein
MFCHGLKARVWDASTSEDIPQKWSNVGLAFRSSKTNEKDGVKWLSGAGHERE